MSYSYQNKKHWSQRLRLLVGSLTLGSALLLSAGCNNVTEQEEIRDGQTNVTTEDLASEDLSTEGTGIEDAETLVGQEVTVRSEIVEQVDATSFTIEANGGEPILVIDTSGTFGMISQDMDFPVQVTGEVARFVLADVESEYGLGLDEATYADFEERPTIIADSWAWAPSTEQLNDNPELFENQVIAMEGNVRNIYSPSAFSLFEDGWIDDYGVVVVGVDENLKADDSALQEGEQVVVTGRTESFDTVASQPEYELGLTPDQLDEFRERYNRPVIIAEDIYPSAVE